MMRNMQTEAAGELPADASVAAYVDKLPETVPAEVMAEVLSIEVKAIHQACAY